MRALTSSDILNLINQNYRKLFTTSTTITCVKKFLAAHQSQEDTLDNRSFFAGFMSEFSSAFERKEFAKNEAQRSEYRVDKSINKKTRAVLDEILKNAELIFNDETPKRQEIGFSFWFMNHVVDRPECRQYQHLPFALNKHFWNFILAKNEIVKNVNLFVRWFTIIHHSAPSKLNAKLPTKNQLVSHYFSDKLFESLAWLATDFAQFYDLMDYFFKNTNLLNDHHAIEKYIKIVSMLIKDNVNVSFSNQSALFESLAWLATDFAQFYELMDYFFKNTNLLNDHQAIEKYIKIVSMLVKYSVNVSFDKLFSRGWKWLAGFNLVDLETIEANPAQFRNVMSYVFNGPLLFCASEKYIKIVSMLVKYSVNASFDKLFSHGWQWLERFNLVDLETIETDPVQFRNVMSYVFNDASLFRDSQNTGKCIKIVSMLVKYNVNVSFDKLFSHGWEWLEGFNLVDLETIETDPVQFRNVMSYVFNRASLFKSSQNTETHIEMQMWIEINSIKKYIKIVSMLVKYNVSASFDKLFSHGWEWLAAFDSDYLKNMETNPVLFNSIMSYMFSVMNYIYNNVIFLENPQEQIKYCVEVVNIFIKWNVVNIPFERFFLYRKSIEGKVFMSWKDIYRKTLELEHSINQNLSQQDKQNKIFNTLSTAFFCIATLDSWHTDVHDDCLATGSNDETIRLWNRLNQECLAIHREPMLSVKSLAMLPSGHLVSGSLDGTICVWDVKRKMCVTKFTGYMDDVLTLAVLADGRLASRSSHGRTFVWDIELILMLNQQRDNVVLKSVKRENNLDCNSWSFSGDSSDDELDVSDCRSERVESDLSDREQKYRQKSTFRSNFFNAIPPDIRIKNQLIHEQIRQSHG